MDRGSYSEKVSLKMQVSETDREFSQKTKLAQPLDQAPEPVGSYTPPTLEVISLDCEISSYAPDGDD